MADQTVTTKFETELSPRVALGVAAHPDDLDFGMSGTVAKWAAAGCEVYYLILTNGNKGSSDPTCDPTELTEQRRSEQKAAAQKLGVKDVYFCDYEDGALEVTMDVKRDIARVIRQVKPEVVLTMDPSVLYAADQGMINHPDHRAAGQAALDAVYPLARDHLSFPELLSEEGLEPHKTASVLLLNFNTQNYYSDISDFIDQKLASLAAHVSQMPDLEKVEDRIRNMAHAAGAAIDVEYAEAYVRIDITG